MIEWAGTGALVVGCSGLSAHEIDAALELRKLFADSI
jgi:hypothetical protein